MRFVFGRTEAAAVVVKTLEIGPWRQDVVAGNGVTVAMVRAVNMAPARLDWQPPTRQDYLSILARHDYLAQQDDPHPAKTLATELGKTNRRSTVRTWLRRARAM